MSKSGPSMVSRLSGHATPDGTARYAKRIGARYPDFSPELALRWLESTHLAVSRMAFGTYRAAAGFDAHFEALREALLTGTNVIDTAHVYGDGAAELLVGNVLAQMSEAGRIKRDEVVVISKAGLIQGQELAALRRGDLLFPDVEMVRPEMAHCIHPQFLRRQLEESLRRMRLESLDVFLLNNPERQLTAAARRHEHRPAALAAQERRLAEAFAFLERCCEEGLIQAYGITSAAFFTEAFDSMPLRPYLRLAGPNFRVVQFRANLLEDGFRRQRALVCEPARRRGLWCQAVRPLNAQSPGGLLRLARLAVPPPDDGAATIAELNRQLDEIEESEELILDTFAEAHFVFDTRAPAISHVVKVNRDQFVNLSHLDRALPEARRMVQRTVNRLVAIARTARARFALEQYVRRSNALFACWRKYAALNHHQLMEPLEEELGRLSEHLSGRPLAVQAVLTLLGDPGVDTVVAGMRRPAYVQMLRQVYGNPPPLPDEVGPLFGVARRFADRASKQRQSAGSGAAV